MKKKDYTVIHLISDVKAIDRAGRKPGKTSISRLAGITPPRVVGVITSAITLGLLYAYLGNHHSNTARVHYGLTDKGRVIMEIMDEYDKSTLWNL